MAGKRQKASKQLAFQRPSRARDEITLVKSADQRVVPRAPNGLHPVAAKAWRNFWSSPLPTAIDMAADDEAIKRWAYCLSERELLEEELRQNPLILGSQGQEVKNPLWDILKERNREVEKFREQFGMTPLHRMRLGITLDEFEDAAVRMNKRRQELGPVPVMVGVEDDESVVEVNG